MAISSPRSSGFLTIPRTAGLAKCCAECARPWASGRYGGTGRGFAHPGREGVLRGDGRGGLLVNESVRIRDDFWLVGLDDADSGGPDVARAQKSLPAEVASLTLMHSPAFFTGRPSRCRLHWQGTRTVGRFDSQVSHRGCRRGVGSSCPAGTPRARLASSSAGESGRRCCRSGSAVGPSLRSSAWCRARTERRGQPTGQRAREVGHPIVVQGVGEVRGGVVVRVAVVGRVAEHQRRDAELRVRIFGRGRCVVSCVTAGPFGPGLSSRRETLRAERVDVGAQQQLIDDLTLRVRSGE